MLRRKFLIRLGLLICAFVLGAAVAIWKLQQVQAELDHANADAAALIDGIQSIDAAVNEVLATRLRSIESGVQGRPVSEAEESLPRLVAKLGTHPLLTTDGPTTERFRALQAALPLFLTQESTKPAYTQAAAESDLRMHRLVQDLASSLRAHVAQEQVRVGTAFRVLVISLTLAAFVMVNVSIFVLLRTTQLVLKPVAALVCGSRELAAERFDHRVVVDHGDEFSELAHAYNSLGEQLKSNEQRKTETLRQLAVTLNHELNNTMSIIEMQLSLLDRRTGTDPAATKPLKEIRAGLMRMSRTVTSLKDIRRIVLVDYPGGQKMIDLPRSVAADEAEPVMAGTTAAQPADGGRQ